MFEIFNMDNMEFQSDLLYDVIYADFIFENLDLRWMDKFWEMLRPGGIFMCQTDYHSDAETKLKMKSLPESVWVNDCIYIQEWGGVPVNAFPRKHDTIFIFAKGDSWKFYRDRIQVPKVTAGTRFDKGGTGMKTPCDVFYDLGNFSTMSNERIKVDGKNVMWQKPLKLMERLLLPATDEGDWVLDPFCRTGTTGAWCVSNGRNFHGIEIDKVYADIAAERLGAL
jgi:DNA modification methylase